MTEKPEIRITFPGGKKVHADLFGRTIETDQSVKAGGEGSAPEPFGLFLASIGTCAGVYVLGFLQSRNLSTDGLEIRQSLQFNQKSGLLEEIAAGYEGKGKSIAGGGAFMVFEQMVQHRGNFNAEACIRTQWRHIIGEEGICDP